MDQVVAPTWLEERSQGIGASESAALLGISPWSTPLSLFLEKSGRVKRRPGLDEAERLLWGNLLEPVIIRELVSRTGRGRLRADSWETALGQSIVVARPHTFIAGGIERTRTHYVVRRRDRPYVLATPDFAFASWKPLPLPVDQVALEGPGWGEAKNASAWSARMWTKGPPLYYQTQIQHQLLAGPDLSWACLGVLVGGNSLRIIDQGRNAAFGRYLEDKIGRFVDYHIQKDIAPEPSGTEEERGRIALAFPEKGGVALLPPEFDAHGARLAGLKKDVARIEDEIGVIENRFRLAIGNASCAVVDGSRSCWSWKTTATGSRRLVRLKDGSLVAPKKSVQKEPTP